MRSGPLPPEDRLRHVLASVAEDAGRRTDTDAELRRFRERIAPSRRSSRRPLALVAAAAAGAVALAGAVLPGVGDRSTDRSGPVAATGTLLEPTPLPDALVQDRIPTSGALGADVHPAAGYLWYAADERTIDRIDPATGAVTPVEAGVTALGPFAGAGGLVWFPGRQGDQERFHALDPDTGRAVTATEPVDDARWIAAGPAGLWAVTGPRELQQLDARSGRAVRTVTTTGSVHDVHVGRDVVYAGAGDGGRGITVVDTTSGRSRAVLPDLATGPMVLAEDGDLWVQDLARPALLRIDGSTMDVEVVVPLPGGTSSGAQREYLEGWGDNLLAYPVVTDGSVYVVVNPAGRRLLLRADARTGEVTHVYETGSGNFAGAPAVDDGSIWIASRHTEPLVRRIRPVT